MTPEMIAAVSAFVLGLGSLLLSAATRRDTAKQSEIDGLRKIIESLQSEVKRLNTENTELRAENNTMRAQIASLERRKQQRGGEW